MRSAVGTAKATPGLRFVAVHGGSARGIWHRSGYVHVVLVKDRANQKRETVDFFPGLEVAASTRSGSVPRARHDFGTLVGAALRSSGMHDESITASLLSKLEFAAEDKETEDAGFFLESLSNSSTEVSASPGKTDAFGEHFAQSLSRIWESLEPSGSSVDEQGRRWECLDLLSTRDHAARLAEFRPHFGALAARMHRRDFGEDVSDASPSTMADLLVRASENRSSWLESFFEELCKRLPNVGLKKVLGVWKLDRQEAADGFGVSQETLEGWLEHGVPADYSEPLANLSAATDILLHYLKADRIPAVVRRPAKRLGGKSLMDLYSDQDTVGVLEACRGMFRFEDVHA